MRCIIPYCLLLRATTRKGALNIANVQCTLCVAFGLNLPWYGSIEWNMEENFSLEWKKIASLEYEKIIFHSIPCPVCIITLHATAKQNEKC